MTTQTYSDLESIISEAIMARQSCVLLPEGTDIEDIRNILMTFIREHPEVTWFSNQFRWDESNLILYLLYNENPANCSANGPIGSVIGAAALPCPKYRASEPRHAGRSRSNRTKRPAVSTYVPAREGKKTGSGSGSLFGRVLGFLGLRGLFYGSSSKAKNDDE
ncbi:MAG: hypothetical protein K2H85_03420, partial [Allobaculum sp.]|nr:hypothetical protein [Allobaculum sp.]